MITVTIQIGNSDDGLTQKQWHDYVEEVNSVIPKFTNNVFFSGAPVNHAPWQNFCWVIGMGEQSTALMKEQVRKIGKSYNQDSVAWTEGNTEFI